VRKPGSDFGFGWKIGVRLWFLLGIGWSQAGAAHGMSFYGMAASGSLRSALFPQKDIPCTTPFWAHQWRWAPSRQDAAPTKLATSVNKTFPNTRPRWEGPVCGGNLCGNKADRREPSRKGFTGARAHCDRPTANDQATFKEHCDPDILSIIPCLFV